MNINVITSVGRGILGDVSDAIASGNYAGLSKRIAGRISDTANGIVGRIEERQISYFDTHKVPALYGVVQVTAGSVLSVMMGIICIANVVAGMLTGYRFTWIAAAVFGLLAVLGLGLLYYGLSCRSLKQFFKSLRLSENKGGYITFMDVAHERGMSLNKVRRMVHTLKSRGLLPGTYFDDQDTTLLLNKQALRQYNAAESARIARESYGTGLKEELPDGDIISYGRSYLTQIQGMQARLSDNDPLSAKLIRLEYITDKILSYVEEHPEKKNEIRHLLDYYLPTTVKLGKAYISISSENENGGNAVKTKEEVLSCLDTVNEAFAKLLDDIFLDTAWDVSSDISVMKTMLERDGLYKEN